jgi:hypothetical protein
MTSPACQAGPSQTVSCYGARGSADRRGNPVASVTACAGPERIVMGMVGSDRSSRDPREVDRYCMLGR